MSLLDIFDGKKEKLGNDQAKGGKQKKQKTKKK